ncbi:hypothetical protein Pelo_7585 [Pelomyxa schiedti]|nr:hypothetical protein Pelo_7585 [Pelomyxa schiedti]
MLPMYLMEYIGREWVTPTAVYNVEIVGVTDGGVTLVATGATGMEVPDHAPNVVFAFRSESEVAVECDDEFAGNLAMLSVSTTRNNRWNGGLYDEIVAGCCCNKWWVVAVVICAGERGSKGNIKKRAVMRVWRVQGMLSVDTNERREIEMPHHYVREFCESLTSFIVRFSNRSVGATQRGDELCILRESGVKDAPQQQTEWWFVDTIDVRSSFSTGKLVMMFTSRFETEPVTSPIGLMSPIQGGLFALFNVCQDPSVLVVDATTCSKRYICSYSDTIEIADDSGHVIIGNPETKESHIVDIRDPLLKPLRVWPTTFHTSDFGALFSFHRDGEDAGRTTATCCDSLTGRFLFSVSVSSSQFSPMQFLV